MSARTDLTGAIDASKGFKLHGAAVHFAADYRIKITPCRAGDARSKGKLKRCFRQAGR